MSMEAVKEILKKREAVFRIEIHLEILDSDRIGQSNPIETIISIIQKNKYTLKWKDWETRIKESNSQSLT